MNPQGAPRPSWPGGVDAASRKSRDSSLTPQTGWWFNIKSAVFEQPLRLRGFGCRAASLDRAL